MELCPLYFKYRCSAPFLPRLWLCQEQIKETILLKNNLSMTSSFEKLLLEERCRKMQLSWQCQFWWCICAAEEYLTFSFQHCHRRSIKNKRFILIYLIPVKMLLVSGTFASEIYFLILIIVCFIFHFSACRVHCSCL